MDTIEIEEVEMKYSLVTFQKGFIQEKHKDDEIFCAWCNKSIKEIGRENLKRHLEEHDEKDS